MELIAIPQNPLPQCRRHPPPVVSCETSVLQRICVRCLASDSTFFHVSSVFGDALEFLVTAACHGFSGLFGFFCFVPFVFFFLLTPHCYGSLHSQKQIIFFLYHAYYSSLWALCNSTSFFVVTFQLLVLLLHFFYLLFLFFICVFPSPISL